MGRCRFKGARQVFSAIRCHELFSTIITTNMGHGSFAAASASILLWTTHPSLKSLAKVTPNKWINDMNTPIFNAPEVIFCCKWKCVICLIPKTVLCYLLMDLLASTYHNAAKMYKWCERILGCCWYKFRGSSDPPILLFPISKDIDDRISSKLFG